MSNKTPKTADQNEAKSCPAAQSTLNKKRTYSKQKRGTKNSRRDQGIVTTRRRTGIGRRSVGTTRHAVATARRALAILGATAILVVVVATTMGTVRRVIAIIGVVIVAAIAIAMKHGHEHGRERQQYREVRPKRRSDGERTPSLRHTKAELPQPHDGGPPHREAPRHSN